MSGSPRVPGFLGLRPTDPIRSSCDATSFTYPGWGASYSRMNQACTALRFFFHVTLGRTSFRDRMVRIPTPERPPVGRGAQEVALLLAHAQSLKDRAALSIAYGSDLRISEIANLGIAHIDSARMLIGVEQGESRKDRYFLLATDLLICCASEVPRGWSTPVTVRAKNQPAPITGPARGIARAWRALLLLRRRRRRSYERRFRMSGGIVVAARLVAN